MRTFFDDYVSYDFPNRRGADGKGWRWPGDEWADEALRHATYDHLLTPPPGQDWEEIVEIGPGSGKYTELLLQRSGAHVTAFELSPAFLNALRTRCDAFISDGRLDAQLIDWSENDGLLQRIAPLQGQVDLYCGIDVFLMMDFQSVFVHLLSAARVLRLGGRFAGTFADPETSSGWARLVRDAGRHSAFDLSPDTRFHWISTAFLQHVLARLGFRVLHSVSDADGLPQILDIARCYLVAELVDPRPALAITSHVWKQA